MQTFTYQSNLFGMMRKLFLALSLFLTILVGQSISFTPAGQASGFTKYNLTTSTASSVDGTGGFSMSGSSFAANTNYYVKVSFDGGSNWYPLTGGTATTGTWLGSGLFTTDGNGEAQIAFQHTRFSDLAAWPAGNTGTISLRASNITQDTFYPGASGSEFTLDLVRPTISTTSIVSNNGTNTDYATTGDQISITFTSSEDLDNSDYPMTGDISGVSFTASGSGTSWTVSNTISTHAEGTATFAISYYDENGNLGATSLSSTTDGSTVTVDKIDPILSVSMSSNNSTTTLAKEDDIVTVAIGSDEILNTAPTVTIDGNSVTPNPNTSSSSYSALRTMESGDTQGIVSIAISNIIDRAGNTATNITESTDASSVTFDSNVPTITGLTIASDNALNSAYAKPDDWVTLTFYTNEKSQTPTATILTEATTETNASGDQLSWTATKQMDADDTDGTITFTIDYYDLAGNQGTQATSIISGTNVTFDGTAPTVSSVTVASSNADATYAKAGDVVSVTIVTDEALSSIASATVAGQSVSGASISEISSTNWKLSYTVTGSESSGSVSYAFTAIDEAGNETSTTSAGSDVVIDNTAPTLTTAEIISNNSNTEYAKEGDVVTLTIVSAEDLIAAPTVYLAGRAATVSAVGGSATDYTATLTMNSTDTQGDMNISIAFTDLAGNDGTSVTATTNNSSVYYDRQVPTLSSVTAASNNSNTAYAKEGDIVTISFTGAENLTSSPTVTIGGNAATVSGTDDTWSATYTMQNGDPEGSVSFAIDFSDLSGNSGTQVTALTTGSLVVYDETTPALSTVDITSNNSEASTLSTSGDIITLSITASENIQSPTVTIAGNAANIASGSNGESVFTATYTMQSSDAATSEIAFTVDFSDLAGNEGTQVTALVNDADGGVEFDKEAPSFTAISIASNNAETTLAKVGDEITVTLTASEDIKTGADPTVTIASNTATVTRNSNTSFSATYTMSSGDNGTDGSSIPINISSFSDPTGNAGTTVSSTTDGSAVTFDMSAPTLGTVSIASDNVYSSYAAEGDIVTLTISASEDLQAPTVSLVGSTTDVTVTEGASASSWTATKTLTAGHSEGTIALNVTFSDLVGNSGTLVSAITTGDNVTYDKTAPTITTATMASDNSTDDILAVPGNTATLTFISSENIQEPTVTISGQSATVSAGADAQNWSAAYQMTDNEDDGTILFSISYTDSAGNAGTAHTTLANDADGGVTFDKTKPELSGITLVTDNGFNPAYAKTGSVVTLTFSANEQLLTSAIDVTIAGVSRSTSKTASWDGTSETWAATYTMTDAYDDEGGAGKDVPFTIDYVDLNGYTGDQVTATSDGTGVTFDKTAPTVSSLTIATDNANDASLCKVGNVVTITFVADELLQTPTIEIAGNGSTESAGGTNATWTGTYTMLATDTEGQLSMSAAFTDYAGNSGSTQTAITSGSNVTFDQTEPTLTAVSIVSNNIYDTSLAKVGDLITLTITADETVTDAPSFTIAGDAVTPTGSGTDWTGVYTMQSDDDAGAIAFSISFEDLAANAGTDVTATVDGSAVTFDKTATDMSGVSVDLDSGSDTGVSSTDNLTNDTTPTFTMTGLAATDSIFLVIDGDTTARDKALSGTLSLTSTTLVEKVLGYSVSVVSRDLTGNVSSASPDLAVRVDTNAPTISSIPNLLESDDSGFYSNDDITNSTQPYLVLAGLPSVRDSIRVFYNIGAGSVYCGAYRMGQATLDTVQVATALDDDDYSFTYVLIDSAGNESSASTGLDVTIDATSSAQPDAPNLLAAYDSGVLSTDDLTNLTTIAFNVTGLTAGDSLYIIDGSSAIVAEELLAGTSSNPTVFNATSSSYAAYTKDIAGNQSLTSESISVEIDQIAPDVTTVGIDLADDSDSGISISDNLTNDYTPEFTITNLTVTDSVYLYVDDVINQRSKATNSTLTFTADSLSDNSHTVAIRSKDLAGNLSLESTTTLTIRVDTTPPNTPSDAPNMIAEDDTGISDSDDTTYTVQPRFEMSDLPSDLDSIRFYYDTGTGNVLSQAQRMSQGITDTIQTSANLSGNSFNFTYTVMDSAGNVSESSPVLPIVVDITPPSVPNVPDLDTANDTGESETDNLTNEERPGITVTGISSGYFSSLYYIDSDNDTTLISTETVPAEETVTYTTPILVSGDYTFFTIATDTAGNTRESSDLSISVDLVEPTATISFDGDSLVRYEDVSTTASFVFSEEMDDVSAPTVDIDFPGEVAVDLTGQLLTNVDDTTWTFDIPLNALGSEDMNGVITLTLNTSDKAGNTLLAGNITGLTVLRVDNTDPVFTSFSPSANSYFNTLNSFGWTLSEGITSGTVIFEQSSGPGSDVNFNLSGTELSAGIHNSSSFNGTPILTDSTVYNIIITSIDTAGNTGIDTISSLTYDVSKPNVALSFDRQYASEDTVILMTATFSELMETNTIPTASIWFADSAGTGYDLVDQILTDSTDDASIWYLSFSAPPGGTNDGYVRVSLDSTVTTDLTLNRLNNITYTDSVYVDNTAPVDTFYYENTAFPLDPSRLRGNGGDELIVTVKWNEIPSKSPLPVLVVDYPVSADDSIAYETFSNGDSLWTYRVTLSSDPADDGLLSLSVNGRDLGNHLPGSYVNNSIFLLDNTPPDFETGVPAITPRDSAFITSGFTFEYGLNDTLETGTINFDAVSGPGASFSVDLSGDSELGIPGNFSGLLTNNATIVSNIQDSTIYNIIFTGADSSGNSGSDTSNYVSYDVSKPNVALSFSQKYASQDTMVLMTATFSELMDPINMPKAQIWYADSAITAHDTTGFMFDSLDDASTWYMWIKTPPGLTTEGFANVTFDTLANSMDRTSLRVNSISYTDSLFIENTISQATFSYMNITDTTQSNIGKGGDTIVVTVNLNEPVKRTDPVPKINFYYANGIGDTVLNVISDSSSADSTVWYYTTTLLDSTESSQNDGTILIEFIADDRSGIAVEQFVNQSLLQVDNIHPTSFTTGNVIIHGSNPVQGWLNGITDSVEVNIPIQSSTLDSTLFLGGFIQIQMYNLTRVTGWVTIGSTDSLTQSGLAQPFYRSISEIENAMVPGTDLVLGDSIQIRSSITDRNGNVTFGALSEQILVYDPSAPVVGEYNGGNMFTMDTLYSNDTLSISWTPFTESGDEVASGIDRYEIAIEKVGLDSIHQFYGWDTIAYPESPLSIPLFLEHDEKYIAHVRSFDVAGNISDTLKTDTLIRYNTAPTIAVLANAVLYEDLPWSDTLTITDPDLVVLQGDSFTYKANTTRIIGATASDSVAIDSVGVLTWQPTQNDTGTYEIQVIVTDAYALVDTFLLPLIVHAVNDTPDVDILAPDNNLSWKEDSGEMVQINLTSYLDDVDNNDTTDITWQVIILDTASLDEDYPLGQVIVGPGTSWHTQNKLAREYLGFNPKLGADLPIVSKKGRSGIEILSAANPLISVSMDMVNNEMWATFTSDSNYYGSNHRVIFIAQDLDGAEDRDTISVTVNPENDPPIIADIEDVEIWENTSISFDFGSFTTDVDDTSLTFTISALTNTEYVAISPSSYLSHNEGDSVVITPQELWSDSTLIQVIASDEAISDTATFEIDILRVERPAPSVAIVQNNAFANYLQVIIVDTVEKTTNISLNIQSEAVHLDTVAAYTWIANFDFEVAKSYSFDVFAQAEVGDTTWSNSFVLSFAQASERWFGSSSDGQFSVSGEPGTVLVDRNFVIVDSSLFSHHFTDKASYGMGDEAYMFKNPVEVTFSVDRDDLAIYQRLNGVTWEELPTITKDGRLLTFTEKAGYFRKGPRTIIVPEETSLRQNYPNPFNPITNIVYDVGLLDGLRQNVSIAVYNILGQHVATLVENHDQIGQFHVQWNGRDKFGQMLPTGIYFVQLRTDTGIVNNRKMMLMK